MKLKDYLALLDKHGILLNSQSLESLDELKGEPKVDNRALQAGDIFFCIKGLSHDGHEFVSDARAKGAELVVCENPFSDELPAIRVSDSRKATALAAKLYYKDPSASFRLIGVTGTNGKTTTSMLLFKGLRELGFNAGWIGTLGYYINDEHYETGYTTPDILELNRILAHMAKNKVNYVAMEVSSHALALDRVYGVEFDFCLFTNLSREHLDFHKSMEDYGAAKLRLFEGAIAHTAVGVVNIDDSFGALIHEQLRSRDAYVFSVGHKDADFVICPREEDQSWEQSRFSIRGHDLQLNIRSALTGGFNITNLSLCAATLNVMGFEARQIEQALNAARSVRGRFERVPNDRRLGVFIDYAHTPDALENVLKAARALKPKRLLCLFGAGGNRDRGKRPLMLKAALQYADAVIISDDNPRTEDPGRIILDIIDGSDPGHPWWIIRDRKQAIAAILRLAQPQDIVLICGKGHETYQEINGVKHEFDDLAVASEFINHPDEIEDDEMVLPVDRLLLEVLTGTNPEMKPGYQPPQTYRRVSTDSRTIKPDSVFFALKGENFDGHAFIPPVLGEESNLAVGDMALAPHPRYIQAANASEALGLLCRKYLLMFDTYKIAITGSTGKTTTKEIMAQVFDAYQPTLKSLANANNLIGLCQTILRIRPQHRFAIFELGTNHFGEIAALADICSPDAGVILNIGPSHLEFLIDEDGVFKEKIALYQRPLGLRLFDADDPRFDAFLDQGRGVGMAEHADFNISDVHCGIDGCEFKLNGELYEIPYPARHYVKNCAFAIALGISLGIPASTIKAAMAEPVNLALRLQVESIPLGTLVADCYNANPVSMHRAIEYWHKILPGNHHVAVLGDMLELGKQAELYHDMIAAILVEHGCDQLITVGDLALRYHGATPKNPLPHYRCVEDLLQSDALSSIPANSVILVKASHGIRLERLLPRLKEGN